MNFKGKKVLVGMSGGVDSSVAAALLAEMGCETAGLSIDVLSREMADARLACEAIGIPHSTIDMEPLFRREVIEPFIQSYLGGRTPSPCILCNEKIKFRTLLEEAQRRGFDFIATGHYARVESSKAGHRLLRGVDKKKDQSYFLFRMTGEDLARTIFPLGNMTKGEVCEKAVGLGLPTRAKKESQEICFVSEDRCAAFIEERAGSQIRGQGNFVDREGKVLGRHRGIHAYTVGQRRRLGFGAGRRQYVVCIDPVRNEVVLGDDCDLARSEMTVGDVSWVDSRLEAPEKCVVQIRSTHGGKTASIEMLGNRRARVLFDEPVRAIAPGQAAVFYVGEEVAGGGWIE